MNNNVLSDFELRRFHEQINLPGIGVEGQLKLKQTKIAIVGVGGIGASALQYLAASGIGFFGLIDDGMVDEHIIQQQTLYGIDDLGKLKTIIAKQRIQTIFPQSEYEIVNLRLTEKNATSILSRFDLVVDATNNPEAGLIINNACIALNLPWVYCNVYGCIITLMVLNYNNGPSLPNLTNEAKVGNLGSLCLVYGLAGLLLTTEIIKMCASLPNTLSNKQLIFNCLNYSVTLTNIKRG
jgi:adenylyltransferase/sulfurtransferase